jgi:hypothetical protein
MSLFNTPVPISPHPRARHSATREGDTIKALAETQSVIARIIYLLSRYSPKVFTDADGNKLEALVAEMGFENNFPFDIVEWIRNSPSPDTPWQASLRVLKYGATRDEIVNYIGITTEESNVGIWGYVGADAPFNFLTKATADVAEYKAWSAAGPTSKMYASETAGTSSSYSTDIFAIIEAAETYAMCKATTVSGEYAHVYASSDYNECAAYKAGATAYIKSGSDGRGLFNVTGADSGYCTITASETVTFEVGSTSGNVISIASDEGNPDHVIGIKEMEICGGQKILVLCSDPWTP